MVIENEKKALNSLRASQTSSAWRKRSWIVLDDVVAGAWKQGSVTSGLRTGTWRLFQVDGPSLAKARRPYVPIWCPGGTWSRFWNGWRDESGGVSCKTVSDGVDATFCWAECSTVPVWIKRWLEKLGHWWLKDSHMCFVLLLYSATISWGLQQVRCIIHNCVFTCMLMCGKQSLSSIVFFSICRWSMMHKLCAFFLRFQPISASALSCRRNKTRGRRWLARHTGWHPRWSQGETILLLSFGMGCCWLFYIRHRELRPLQSKVIS